MPPLRGAYGLALDSPPVAPEWWVEAPQHWDRWRLESLRLDQRDPSDRREEPGCITIQLQDGIAVYQPESATTTIYTDREPEPHGLVHPYFGQTAALHAWSRGWTAFHAGAFVIDSRVWAVLGDREYGKSSALAWMLCSGHEVFADDLVVLDGTQALAGPRSLDLREGASRHFGIGAEVGVVGARRRWRANLGPIPAELPLAGWILLEWQPGAPAVRRATAREGLVALAGSTALLGLPLSGPGLLDLVSVPMFVLRRPKVWSSMDTAMRALLRALETSAA